MAAVSNTFLAENQRYLTKYASENDIVAAQTIFDELNGLVYDPIAHFTPEQMNNRNIGDGLRELGPALTIRNLKYCAEVERVEYAAGQALNIKQPNGKTLLESLRYKSTATNMAMFRLGLGTSTTMAMTSFAKLGCITSVGLIDCVSNATIRTVSRGDGFKTHHFVVFGNVPSEEFLDIMKVDSNVLLGLKKLGKGIILDKALMSELVPTELIETHPAAKNFFSHVRSWDYRVLNICHLKVGQGDLSVFEEAEKVYQASLTIFNAVGYTKSEQYQVVQKLEPNEIFKKMQSIFGNNNYRRMERVIWSDFATKEALCKDADYFAAYSIPIVCGQRHQSNKFFIQLKPAAINYDLFENLPSITVFNVLRVQHLMNSVCHAIIRQGELSSKSLPLNYVMEIIQNYL